jgi:hypothetical protein
MKHPRKMVALALLVAAAFAVPAPASAQGIGGRLRRAVQQHVAGKDTAQAQPAAQPGQQGTPAQQPAAGGMGSLGGMMGQQMMAQYSQMIMNQIMPMVFAMAFHSGTYSFQEKEYQPGEYTLWRMTGGEEHPDTAFLQRAFMGKAADGSQWWHVAYIFSGQEGKKDTLTLEGEFSADRTKIIRMRGQMPGQAQPAEMPVQENTFGYMPPTMLTAQSLAGATVGTESVTVPAGTFHARHVRFGDMTGGSLDWWLDDSVPGGMVKYTVGGGAGGGQSVLELMQKGTGFKSTLGVTIQ